MKDTEMASAIVCKDALRFNIKNLPPLGVPAYNYDGFFSIGTTCSRTMTDVTSRPLDGYLTQ